jgi:hypothetical protein
MTPADTDVILLRLDKQDELLVKIEAHGAETNGRVTELERQREIEEALAKERLLRRARRRAFFTSWIAPGLAAVIGGAATYLFS